MFIDTARILVKGGDGGNGIVAFRREKYVPLGGPSGGDGGRGGNVILVVDQGLSTLMDFKYRRHFKAGRGSHGQGKNMHGAGGDDLIVKIPPGTVVIDDDSGEILADMVGPEQKLTAARGGRGGKGNARFATSLNKAPSVSENGEPGQERWIRLELKLLADVGLVGFPNAGKSTLISKMSAARPKIADYPFTTLVPNLGVVSTRNKESYVVADIPGLIEGAHLGAGLGHDFLRHIERTRMLLFVLDMGQTEGRDCREDLAVLRSELTGYASSLSKLPYLIIANKMDLPESAENLEKLRLIAGNDQIIAVSAATGENITHLIEKTYQMLSGISETPPVVTHTAPAIHRFEPEEEPFTIEIVDGVYQVNGKRIEKLVAMTNFNTDESLQRFQHTIEKMGLEKALQQKGIKPGDTVRIVDLEFDYSE